MTPVIVGILSGFFVIFIVSMLRSLDKATVYGLILSAIGFLYVGYAWTDLHALFLNSLQAIFFLFTAYYGIKKNLYYLIAGYFLHGIWDLLYHLFSNSNLIPPNYDLFCLSIDFTMGFYLLLIKYGRVKSRGTDESR